MLISPAVAVSPIASIPVPAEESKRDASTGPFCSIIRSCVGASELFVIANVGTNKPITGFTSTSIPPLLVSNLTASAVSPSLLFTTIVSVIPPSVVSEIADGVFSRELMRI